LVLLLGYGDSSWRRGKYLGPEVADT
jgi:hypothetical protein